MNFKQHFILAKTFPDTAIVTGFTYYPVMEIVVDNEISVEECEAHEAHGYGLYAIINAAENMWIADADTEENIKILCGLMQAMYRAGFNSSHPLPEEKSFAGWTVSDLMDIAENDELELNEEEAGKILDLMLNECDAGDGVPASLLNQYITNFIDKRDENQNDNAIAELLIFNESVKAHIKDKIKSALFKASWDKSEAAPNSYPPKSQLFVEDDICENKGYTPDEITAILSLKEGEVWVSAYGNHKIERV